jgi:hypothetical protein
MIQEDGAQAGSALGPRRPWAPPMRIGVRRLEVQRNRQVAVTGPMCSGKGVTTLNPVNPEKETT